MVDHIILSTEKRPGEDEFTSHEIHCHFYVGEKPRKSSHKDLAFPQPLRYAFIHHLANSSLQHNVSLDRKVPRFLGSIIYHIISDSDVAHFHPDQYEPIGHHLDNTKNDFSHTVDMELLLEYHALKHLRDNEGISRIIADMPTDSSSRAKLKDSPDYLVERFSLMHSLGLKFNKEYDISDYIDALKKHLKL